VAITSLQAPGVSQAGFVDVVAIADGGGVTRCRPATSLRFGRTPNVRAAAADPVPRSAERLVAATIGTKIAGVAGARSTASRSWPDLRAPPREKRPGPRLECLLGVFRI
jgi:hypothetical protein